MKKQTLAQVREYVVHGNRMAALDAVRSAIDHDQIGARDGIELMLAVRQGSREVMLEAMEMVRCSQPGSYRYVPKADYAFA
jgi:hypothetical protein